MRTLLSMSMKLAEIPNAYKAKRFVLKLTWIAKELITNMLYANMKKNHAKNGINISNTPNQMTDYLHLSTNVKEIVNQANQTQMSFTNSGNAMLAAQIDLIYFVCFQVKK